MSSMDGLRSAFAEFRDCVGKTLELLTAENESLNARVAVLEQALLSQTGRTVEAKNPARASVTSGTPKA